jgi:acyl-coenzyme A thioesterase PaaI-like protein
MTPVSDPTSLFEEDADGRLVPTELSRGPWDPRALHGGAPAALLTGLFEALEPGAHLRIARLGFELLRPVPFAPLTVTTRILRPGRRVQELEAELHADDPDGGEPVLICRANALRVQEVPPGLPAHPDAVALEPAMPGPQEGEPVVFSLSDAADTSFAATAMQMRWLDDPRELGPARVWMRLGPPALPGGELSPLARAAATADFGNGIAAALPFAGFLFINADLTLHLHRQPMGEWIGLQARTLLHEHGTGLAESVLHDEHGPIGRAFQTLVVQAR